MEDQYYHIYNDNLCMTMNNEVWIIHLIFFFDSSWLDIKECLSIEFDRNLVLLNIMKFELYGSTQNNQLNTNIISAEADDDFVSPPEISDESKNGLHSQNSAFPSFELSASKNNNFSNSFNGQTRHKPVPHFSSIFGGIDIHDLPPQIILSDENEQHSNIESNTTNTQAMHTFSTTSSAQKIKQPSIFGNIQFENLPPVFNTQIKTDFSLPNSNIPNFQAASNFNNTKSKFEVPIQKINNFIINDNEKKFRPEKIAPKHIPQQILMPLPAIMQTKSLTTANPNDPPSFNRGMNGNFDYNSERLSNKKEESFDNSGFIDVTDYF